MTTVARGYGQRFMTVWHEPFDETLLAYVGLMEQRRVESLETRAQRVLDAYRINAAILEPATLAAEQREVSAALRGQAQRPPLSRDEAKQLADDMLQRLATKTFVPVI